MTTYSGNLDGTGLRVALVCSRLNDLIVERLEAGARDTLVRHGVADDAIDTLWYHFEVVANQSAAGLARVALDTGVVVTNGIITVDSIEQALERAGSKAGNKGADAALAALETVVVLRNVTA